MIKDKQSQILTIKNFLLDEAAYCTEEECEQCPYKGLDYICDPCIACHAARYLYERGCRIKKSKRPRIFRPESMIKSFLKTLLAVLWCLVDPKKATAAANEAATVEEFDQAMMKEWRVHNDTPS